MWGDAGLYQSPVVTGISWQSLSWWEDQPFSLLSVLCLCGFVRFYLSSIVYSFVLGIDLPVVEYSVTVSFGKFSSIFLPGLHVLIDSVLFTTYIWSLLGKVMIYLQIGRMRLICRRLCPSKLWALKWNRFFAEFIRSFLRLRRTPDFGQLWHVNPSVHSVRDDMMIPCCPHWHDWLTDFAALLPRLPTVSERLGTQLPDQGCYHKCEFQLAD